MKIEGKRFEVRTNVNQYQKKMLKALGIEEPKKSQNNERKWRRKRWELR